MTELAILLAPIYGALAAYLLREGWRRRNGSSNPHTDHDLLVSIDGQLEGINRRLEDIWEKVKD